MATWRHRKEGAALYDKARSHEGTSERRHTSVASKHEGHMEGRMDRAIRNEAEKRSKDP